MSPGATPRRKPSARPSSKASITRARARKGHQLSARRQRRLASFIAQVRERYGEALRDVLVFGSRARGDARRDSDLDLALILDDGDWREVEERRWLVDAAYPILVETGLHIQNWPIARSVWQGTSKNETPFFVIGARREARPIEEFEWTSS